MSSAKLVVLVGLTSCVAPSQPAAPVELTPAPVHEPAPPAEDDHASAQELVRAFDGEAALTLYTHLLVDDHTDVRAGIGLAQTGLEFGLEQRAGDALARVVDGDKTHALAARVGIALLRWAEYEASGDPSQFDACESQLRNVLAVEPNHDHALALAVILYLERAQRHAEAQAPQARAVCQAHEGGHAMLAASCAEEAWRRGDPARARALFDQATRDDPEQHGAYLRWGMLELQAGNLRSAQRYFERASGSAWPSLRSAAQASLGVALDRLGDPHAALASYRAAQQLYERMQQPLPAELLLNLGVAAGRIADSDAALDEARALLEQYVAREQPDPTRRLQVERALNEIESIRAEHQRMQ